MKNFSFAQWAKIDLTKYKDQQFATKQDHHFVLSIIKFFYQNGEIFLPFFEVNH